MTWFVRTFPGKRFEAFRAHWFEEGEGVAVCGVCKFPEASSKDTMAIVGEDIAQCQERHITTCASCRRYVEENVENSWTRDGGESGKTTPRICC